MSRKPPIIEKLPKLKIRELLQLWRNCVTYLADPNKAKMHKDARLVIDAINKEWLQRGKKPLEGDEFFDWPSTDANRGNGGIDTQGWLLEGLLKVMGYKVGMDGLAQNLRQRILAEIFSATLPPVFPDAYFLECGRPESSQRLKKMAETIAALTRNARRRGKILDVAIKSWEQDLEFLYYEYYVEKFHFGWPSTQAA